MPKFPPALSTIWSKFQLLGVYRSEYGINFQEMQAFSQTTGVHLSHWEVHVLIQLNDAALRGRSEAYHRDHNEELVEQIPVTNQKGIKALFKGLAVKWANKDKDKQ